MVDNNNDVKQQSRDHKREAYVDSNLAMQRIRHIEEEEEMRRNTTGRVVVRQRSLTRILKVIKGNATAVGKQKQLMSTSY